MNSGFEIERIKRMLVQLSEDIQDCRKEEHEAMQVFGRLRWKRIELERKYEELDLEQFVMLKGISKIASPRKIGAEREKERKRQKTPQELVQALSPEEADLILRRLNEVHDLGLELDGDK